MPILTDSQLKATDPPTILDNTMRVQLSDCPRLFYWFLRGYDYKLRPSFFSFGSAWHAILAKWYTLHSEEELIPGTDRWLQVASLAEIEGLTLWDNSGSEDIRNDSRNQLSKLWQKYILEFPTEHWTQVAPEQGWIYPLPPSPSWLSGKEYFLAGSIDGYLRWENYGTLVREDKTTGMWLSDNYIGQWRFSTQVTGYIWYATQLRGEATNCLVNMACKQIPKTTGGKTEQFSRKLESRSEEQLDGFITDLFFDIELLEKCWERWIFPKSTNPINCSGGVGRSPCLFRPVCSVDAAPEYINPLDFPFIGERKEKWEPWKRRGDQD